MTRSTLLHLLAHPASLTGANVHELEQLAQAFPYCQTAHLLLAKAAHDQGSMLAGQRLRRAATYAADRALLRQLIELPASAAPTLAELVAAEAEAPTLAAASPQPVDRGYNQPTQYERLPAQAEQPAEPTEPEAALFEVEHAQLPEPAATELPVQALPAAEAEDATASESIAVTSADAPAATQEYALAPQPIAPADAVAPEDELPAQAPPIRPPAEAEAARFEFGLADAEPAEITAYRLPELAEPAILPELAVAPVAATLVVPPVFTGASDVGYAPGEGSRLGFCLQSPAAEVYSLTTGPAALLPSTALPPANEFFAPDALLLAHLASAQPPVETATAPIATDLINSFLRRGTQGVPRRRATPPPPDAEDEEQPDLSGPSTRAVPDLASENLAKILARQGKTDRAIAIYERLMVKHPEKMAYFAAQIESLRPQA